MTALIYLAAGLAAAFVAGAYSAVWWLARNSDELELARCRAELHERSIELIRVTNRLRVARTNEKALADDVVRLTRDLRAARKATSA